MNTGVWGVMSGAAGAVDSLRRAGVKRVFAIAATENTPLFAALRESALELVVVTQEQSAPIMADVHARLTGELSACLVRSGPSLASVLGGVVGARLDSSPLLVLVSGSAQLPIDPRMRIQDPLVGVGTQCKGVLEAREPEEVPPAISSAVRLALGGEPGPVIVAIPEEVQRAEGQMEGTGFRLGPRTLSAEAERDLDALQERIDRAKAVCLYVGAGCLTAVDEVRALSERLEAPVATTLSALGLVPQVLPLSAGFGLGPAASPLAERVFQRSDLVVAVGCKLWELAQLTPPGAMLPPLVHIDVDPTPLDAAPPVALTVTAPAKLALRFLLDRVGPKQQPEQRELIRQEKRRLRQTIAQRPVFPDAVDPVKLFVALRDLLGGEDILILDSGRQAVIGVACYPVQGPRTLLLPAGFRGLGFSVPAAVASKLARPDLAVVACVGDGGFLLAGNELLTARRCNVAPVVVVLSEGPASLLKKFPARLIQREHFVDLAPVNFEELARAMDIGYVRILRDAELTQGLQKALVLEAPTIVEVRVSYQGLGPEPGEDWSLNPTRLPRALQLRLGARRIQERILEGGGKASS